MPVNINFNRSQGGYELANNLETTIAGVAALDAVQGKKLKELIANVVAPQWLEQGATVNIDSKSLNNFIYGLSEVTLGTRPYTYGVLLNIRRSNTDVVQVAYSITGNQSTSRYSTSNGWSDWVELATKEDSDFDSGDLITFIMAQGKAGELRSNYISLPNASSKRIEITYIEIPSTEELQASSFSIIKRKNGFYLLTSDTNIVNKYQNRAFLGTFKIS